MGIVNKKQDMLLRDPALFSEHVLYFQVIIEIYIEPIVKGYIKTMIWKGQEMGIFDTEFDVT